MIPENFIVFYEGESEIIEGPYFCHTKKEALQEYEKWAKNYPEDAGKLYIAKIIRKPLQTEAKQ